MEMDGDRMLLHGSSFASEAADADLYTLGFGSL